MRAIILALICLPLGLLAQDIAVTFPGADSLILEGTLSLPAGGGPHPAVVFVHGSGPQDRHQTAQIDNVGNLPCLFPGHVGQTLTSFKDLGDALVGAGFAVLRYDKRTFTHTTLDPMTISVHDFVGDAKAGLDFLRSRGEVDASQLVVLGHSQGATLAPYVAAGESGVCGVVALAGPSTAPDSLILEQTEFIIDSCGDPGGALAMLVSSWTADFASLRAGTWPANMPLVGAFPPFWESWIEVGDSVVDKFNQVGLPALLTFGTRDYNVPVAEAAPFSAGLTIDADIHIFQGLDHQLTDGSLDMVYQPLIDTLIAWLLVDKVGTGIPDRNEFLLSLHDLGNHWQLQWADGGAAQIELIDVQGKVIRRQEARGSALVTKGGLASSLYVVRVRAGNRTASRTVWLR